MTLQQQQQVEIAFKTRGKIPPGLIAEFFGMIVDIVMGLINRKKNATVQEKHDDLRWVIDQVILPGMKLQGEKLADMGETLIYLRTEFNKLKAQIAA